MKFIKLLKEHSIKPYHKNLLKSMDNRGISEDIEDIWDFLSDTLTIEDTPLKMEVIHLYRKYYDVIEEDNFFELLSDKSFDDMEDFSDIEDERIALSQFLDLPPQLVIETDNNHYDLNVYRDITTNSEYAVGTDDEADAAMATYFEGYVDNMGGLNYVDRYHLDDFIELDSWAVTQFCEEEAENRVADMTEDAVIEEAGYEPLEYYQDQIDELESLIEELNSDIEILESDKEDMEMDNEDGDYDDEIEELEEKISDIEYDISDKESESENLESEKSNLYETAKEELLESYTDDLESTIEQEGLDYFINNFGLDLETAVESFATFDNDGYEEHLATSEYRGDILGIYNGVEEYEIFDEEYYYIYQTEG
jgi:hypothetical protein